MNRKVGLFGGTFDPIHNAHITTALDVLKAFDLDEILFLPSGTPPHKMTNGVTKAQDRVEMLELALNDYPQLGICYEEVHRTGTTYTIDTLNALTEKFPKTKFFFIVGSDVVLDILSWREAPRVFTLCSFIALYRPGYSDDAVTEQINRLNTEYNADIILYKTNKSDISSSEIRERVRRSEDISVLVPKAVENYIFNASLYTNDCIVDDVLKSFPQLDDIFEEYADGCLMEKLKKLSGLLTRKRLFHSINTLLTAYELALLNDSSHEFVKKTLVAALLHDCGKQAAFNESEMEKRCKQYGITEHECGKYNSAFMHAHLGEVYAKEIFGVDDVEILNSIRYHTTGCTHMTLLEKIIYIADYIEPTRSFTGIKKARILAKKDICACMAYIAEHTIEYVRQQNKYLHPNTLAVYNEYKNRSEKSDEKR